MVVRNGRAIRGLVIPSALHADSPNPTQPTRPASPGTVLAGTGFLAFLMKHPFPDALVIVSEAWIGDIAGGDIASGDILSADRILGSRPSMLTLC